MRRSPFSTQSAEELWCPGRDTKPSPGPVYSAGATPQANPITFRLLHPLQWFTVAPQRGALKTSSTQIWTLLMATITNLFRDPNSKEKNKKLLINDLIQQAWPACRTVREHYPALAAKPRKGMLVLRVISCFSGICLDKAKRVYQSPSSLSIFIFWSVWGNRLSDLRLLSFPPLWMERTLGLQACFPWPATLLPSCHQGQNQEHWNGRRKLIPHDTSGKGNTHQGLWKTDSLLASQPCANLWGLNEIQLKQPGQRLLIQNELNRWTFVHLRVTWPCSTLPRLSPISIWNASNNINPSVGTAMQDELFKKLLKTW